MEVCRGSDASVRVTGLSEVAQTATCIEIKTKLQKQQNILQIYL